MDLVRIGVGIGRLDQRLASRGADSPERDWFVRRESIDIAARESRLADEIRLCGYVGQVSDEASDQALRLASDIGDGIRIVLKWEATPSATDIRQVWEASNASNLMLLGAEKQWQLDSAYGRIAELMDLMLTDPSIEKAEHLIHEIWVEKAFGIASRRMALMLAPYVIRRAFDAPSSLIGIAKNLAIPIDVLDEPTRDERIADFADALRKGTERSLQASLKIARLEDEFSDAIASKKGSGAERAIRQLISTPVLNASALVDLLAVTHKGAILILDRFEQAGILSKLDPTRTRKKAFICHKAINL